MSAADTVRGIIEAFTADAPRAASFADGFRVVGVAEGAPLLAFGVPTAGASELDGRGMRISFDEVTPSAGDHVLVWGTWSGDGQEERTYHVVAEVRDGRVAESRFFDDIEHARWFAGL